MSNDKSQGQEALRPLTPSEQELADAGYVRRPDGFWMMPPGVGLGPAASVYADWEKGWTLD